jgi:CRP-like cAMP-binding protein
VRKYPKDVMVFAEGEPGEEVFIIKSGLVKISKVVEDGEVLLAVLKAGDVFGEMAVLDSSPRVASVISLEECQLMVLNRENFQQMIKTQPQLITRLTSLLAERIWLAYKQLANTRIFDPLGRLYDMLYIQLEKHKVDFDTKRNFQFDFGIKELLGMVGLPQKEGSMVIQKLLQSRQIEVIMDKIRIENVLEFSRQATYYRKAQEGEVRRRNR